MIRLRSFATLAGTLVTALLCLSSVHGQPSSSASQIAQRQNLIQEYKRLNSAVEEVMAAQTAQARRLSEVADNVRQLEQNVAANNKKYATMEDVRRLEGAIKALEKKIENNNQLILEELKKLRQDRRSGQVVPQGGGGGGPSDSGSSGGVPAKYDEGYWYTIQEGQTLWAVVMAYRKQGVDVTLDMLKAANPDVDPNKIQPGDKIWVPDPSK